MTRPAGLAPDTVAAARAAYRALNDSPWQRRLREQAEWFAGMVYWRPGDYDWDELVYEFRRIKELGFTAVRFHSSMPEQTAPGEYDYTRADDWFRAAEAAGIGVIFHGERVLSVSDETLAKHGIAREEYAASYLEDERMQAAIREDALPVYAHFRHHPCLYAWGLAGEPNAGDLALSSDLERANFAAWLRARYGTIEALDAAWSFYPIKGKPCVPSFEEAWREVEDYNPGIGIATTAVGRKSLYGAVRDMMRYQTEKTLRRLAVASKIAHEGDPDHPHLLGSHQLFINQAYLRWDTGEWARKGDCHFSSIHMSWHFEQVEGEVDRPVVLQSRLTRDYFKDGWTSAFETTGGAVQYSGGYGNSMSAGLMRRLICAYLGTGNLALAFWTWNHRLGGMEAGEYGMTSLSGALTPWAHAAGDCVRGLAKYHRELWEADQETKVGVLQNWDNDAVHVLEAERYDLAEGTSPFNRGTKVQPWRAEIGIGRALTDAHIPFEYVTGPELLEGIAAAYPAIYLPHMRGISAELMEALAAYVRAGGRLIADVQVAFEDPWSKVHPTGPGELVDRAFGAYVDMIHDSRTGRVSVNGMEVEGFIGDLVPTSAKVIARFDDGRPAITEAVIGRGSAVLIGFDAARMCWKPGRPDIEGLIAALCLADDRTGWTCTAPIALRRTTLAADHYFLLNDGPAQTAWISAPDRVYTAGEDVLTGAAIDVSGTIAVPLEKESAMWVRLARG